MRPVTCSATILREPEVGPLLQITFRGECPGGSLGEPTAKVMERDLARAIDGSAPAGVIINCSELEYRWGDALCRLARPLRRPDGSFLPACIVARGDTRAAITPLVASRWLLAIAGVRLVGSVDEARRDLVARSSHHSPDENTGLRRRARTLGVRLAAILSSYLGPMPLESSPFEPCQQCGAKPKLRSFRLPSNRCPRCGQLRNPYARRERLVFPVFLPFLIGAAAAFGYAGFLLGQLLSE
jgi:hypothetical protein